MIIRWLLLSYISSAVIQFKRKIGETVNVTWEASTIPAAGGYNIYHKNIRNTISQKNSTIRKEQQTDDRNVIVMLEIRNVSPEDAGYYNGGSTTSAVMSGGGAILIVLGMKCLFSFLRNSSKCV